MREEISAEAKLLLIIIVGVVLTIGATVFWMNDFTKQYNAMQNLDKVAVAEEDVNYLTRDNLVKKNNQLYVNREHCEHSGLYKVVKDGSVDNSKFVVYNYNTADDVTVDSEALCVLTEADYSKVLNSLNEDNILK